MTPAEAVTNLRFDAVVLGGGPAGMAVALALTQGPAFSVTVIEKDEKPRRRFGESIPPESRLLLEKLRVWEAFQNDGHLKSYGTSACWGSDERYHNDYLTSPFGHGWHLDRARFENSLSQQALAQGVTLFRGASVTDAQENGDGWSLRIRRAEQELVVGTGFVVDATGRRRFVSRRQSANPMIYDELCGVFMFFACDPTDPLRDTSTLVESCEDGWWYSALLPEQQIVVGFMTDANSVRQLKLRRIRNWSERLRQTVHTRQRVEHARALTAPAVTAANSYLLDRMWSSRYVAVGDAASTFDPLSSQGIMKGMRWGLRAAQDVKSHLEGNQGVLQQYEDDVRAEYDQYLKVRHRFYSMENRWPDSPFWSRRRSPVAV